MIGHEIVRTLMKDPRAKHTFQGVFPRDVLHTLHINTRYPSAYVINTATQHEPGEHWVVVWIRGGYGEYFDSYGIPPMYPEIEMFLKRHCNSFRSNRMILQGMLSRTCGHYCIYYIKQKSRGYSMAKLLIPFHPLKYYTNDKKIRGLVQR